jgi:2-oxo-4-hydroxy-4-carboxy-5-ureidoimidazoline decarboxylase
MTAPAKVTLTQLATMDREAFIATLGEVFEHSPWVAEAAWPAAPFASRDALLDAMVRGIQEAGRERQLELIRAHPDLAGTAAIAGEITAESRREQARAGLDHCTPTEFARFNAFNEAYKARLGFPFILAVKGQDTNAILESFAERIANDTETEFARALAEIARIAAFRLEDLIEDGT